MFTEKELTAVASALMNADIGIETTPAAIEANESALAKVRLQIEKRNEIFTTGVSFKLTDTQWRGMVRRAHSLGMSYADYFRHLLSRDLSDWAED